MDNATIIKVRKLPKTLIMVIAGCLLAIAILLVLSQMRIEPSNTSVLGMAFVIWILTTLIVGSIVESCQDKIEKRCVKRSANEILNKAYSNGSLEKEEIEMVSYEFIDNRPHASRSRELLIFFKNGDIATFSVKDFSENPKYRRFVVSSTPGEVKSVKECL